MRPAGTTSKTVTVRMIEDGDDEGMMRGSRAAVDWQKAMLGDAVGTATIEDYDDRR